jgi:site-specific DNA-methyltransferase (adenine-specific)
LENGMKIEQWSPEKLIDYARNPRKNDHAVERVAAAIREFGFRVPIIAKSDGLVVDGHLRLKAARKLGLTSVPVVLADDMSETQIKAFRISVNRMAELAEWDTELLALEMQDLTAAGVGMDLSGFSSQEFDALIVPSGAEEKKPAPDIEEDEPPKAQEKANTRAGDVWLLGEHRVMCGDSTSAEIVKSLCGDILADAVLTDPPYGVNYIGKTKDALPVHNDGADTLHLLLKGALKAASDQCKAGACWYVFSPPGPLFFYFASVLRDLDIWRQTLVWVKHALVLGHSDYHYKHEPIFYGWKPGAAHKPPPDRMQVTVWDFDRPMASREHPTMKPVGLLSKMISNSTKMGDLIFDPFLGSGTTLIAAEQLGRKCYGMELSPQYCDVIVKRWQTLTGKQAVRESDGTTFDQAGQV